ncbi:MAG: class I SAM-dependent methyltransferase [Desulfobacterales bacterium]
MEMTRLEKWFVNRSKKAERNIARVRQRLQELPTEAIQDVLELGCGIGTVAAYLAATYEMNVYGTDYDAGQIQIARNMQPQNEHLHYSVEDAASLSFQDASFDLVVSQNAFHHIPDWKTATKEVARVLRPRGHFIWLDLAFPKLFRTLFQPLVKNQSLYCFADIRRTFQTHGFKQVFYERLIHGLFVRHHLVWQKK